jgi:hypothetical protein
MCAQRQIEVSVRYHPAVPPNGNRTLSEREPGASFWTDVQDADLHVNHDAVSFYRAVANRLAEHARNGIVVVNYADCQS